MCLQQSANVTLSHRVLTDLNSVEEASRKVVKAIQHLQFLVVYL